MKNVLAISGSRNPEGYTAKAISAFAEGVRKNGGQTEIVFLPELNLERCRQCENSGWGECRSKGKCIIKDDFSGLVEKIRLTDGLVFGNPVYYGDLSESLRTFLDRLRRISTHEDGQKGIHGKNTAGICVSGGGGSGSYLCAQLMEKTLTQIGLNTIDIIPARRQNFEMKLKIFKITGEWYIQQ